MSEHPAIAQLNSHRRFLISFARKMGLDREDAYDIAQDTMVRAIQRIEDFRGGTNEGELRAWLLTILRNMQFSRWRHEKFVRRRQAMDCDPQYVEAKDGTRFDLEQAAQMLRGLSPDRRLCVCEFIAGRSYEEIAERMGWPIGTVKSNLSRARKALRAC